MRWGDGMKPLLAPDVLADGLMKVSIERGLYKQVDVGKVSAGAHYTEGDCWLQPPVDAFIRAQIHSKQLRHVLDPFAGDGHLLRLIGQQHGLSAHGLDLHAGDWPRNDSLRRIPAQADTLICTNPPYLAKYSARRKGVWPLVADYFDDSGYDDLYLLAIARMLATGMPVVAIIPETFIASGLFREHLERVVVLETSNPFVATETPVCVACFDPAVTATAIRCYKDNRFIGLLGQLEAGAELLTSEFSRRQVTFNVAKGMLALKAVDGTRADDRIRFLKGADFGYDTGMIKVSSRLMTRIHVEGLNPQALDALIVGANAELERIRESTQDMVLSPFKGNNKSGIRRRRLDYRLARLIIASVLETLPGSKGSESLIFALP